MPCLAVFSSSNKLLESESSLESFFVKVSKKSLYVRRSPQRNKRGGGAPRGALMDGFLNVDDLPFGTGPGPRIYTDSEDEVTHPDPPVRILRRAGPCFTRPERILGPPDATPSGSRLSLALVSQSITLMLLVVLLVLILQSQAHYKGLLEAHIILIKHIAPTALSSGASLDEIGGRRSGGLGDFLG
ncbi:hypothetical protein C8J57DRAFT_1480632 [Mycena rebaudengoi]|nr:hypothetical protein C8J57DRAFT_1480632 [Mycena rebaudengoi]